MIKGKVSAPVERHAGSASSYSRGVFVPSTRKEGEKKAKEAEPQEQSVAVWAEPVGNPAPFAAPAKKPSMIQQEKKFIPGLLVVQAGATVSFPNLDPLYHNVFSYSRAKRFDLGRYAAGKSKDVRFDEPGLVEVFCEIHENMHAFILVVNTPWFTTLERNGEYSLQVPPGRYRIKAWIPNRESDPQEVDVTGQGELRADFAF